MELYNSNKAFSGSWIYCRCCFKHETIDDAKIATIFPFRGEKYTKSEVTHFCELSS